MNTNATSMARTRLLKGPATIGVVTALALLLAVQGSMALSGDALAANAWSPASLFSTLERETDAVVSQANRLVADLRLVYEIRVLVADDDSRAEVASAAGSEPVNCRLSATGLVRAWAN